MVKVYISMLKISLWNSTKAFSKRTLLRALVNCGSETRKSTEVILKTIYSMVKANS